MASIVLHAVAFTRFRAAVTLCGFVLLVACVAPPSGAVSPSATVGPTASLGPSQIDEKAAIAEAAKHVQAGATPRGAVAGVFGDVFKALGNGSVPEADVKASDAVWVVTFEETFQICPPDGSDCFSPRPGTTEVVLDYVTGRFLFSSSYAPNPK